MAISSTKYFSLFITSTLLLACGGGGSGGNDSLIDPENCAAREFFNDTAGTPAAYFNGQIPVSSQTPQGDLALNSIYEYDSAARTITVTETNTLHPGSTIATYLLDELGRPTTKNERVVNSAIQLDIRNPELRFSFDSDGLLTGYTMHRVVDNITSDLAYASVAIDWSEVGGISTSTLTPDASSDVITATTSYTYTCDRLVDVMVETEFESQSAMVENYTVVTSGSGKALTTTITRAGSTAQGRRLVFDTNGNLVDRYSTTINYEATTEPFVNIVLFEHALRYSGLI